MTHSKIGFSAISVWFLSAGLIACGGGSSGGSATVQPTITSVSVVAAPTSVSLGQTSTCTATVSGTGSYGSGVIWSAMNGTITAAGVLTPAAIGTSTCTATATQSYGGTPAMSGSATVTVTTPPPTVTIAASSSTTTVGTPITLTWSSTYATSCTASGAWSGTEATSGSLAETQTATGTATYTLGCMGAGGSASASATVTVNPVPVPNVTAVFPGAIFVDWANVAIAGVVLSGSNFVITDTVYPTGFNDILSESLVNSTEISLELQFGQDYSPGWLTFAVCENSNDTNCGTSQSMAFLGAQNYLATSPSGEFFFLDQAQGLPAGQNGYVRTYASSGTSNGSFFVGGTYHSIAVDPTTGYVIIDGGPINQDGSATYIAPQGLPSGAVDACAGYGGYAGFVQPANNSASFYALTGGSGSQPTVHTASSLGTTPWAIAMGTFGSETDAFVVSVGDTPSPMLHKVRASDAYTGEEPALSLTGISSLSTVVSASLYAGGLQEVVFDSGPDSGTVAVLSTYDQLLLFVNTSTWAVTKSVQLSGVPFRIVADKANGRVLVAYANFASVTTTYAWVNASTGVITPLTATSSLLSVGLGFSGTNIISTQRNQIDLKLAQ